MRYFIELSYNGTRYHGWQTQPNAASVQQTLNQALSTLLRQPIEVVGAGRTDTGVHARQMFAHFDYPEKLDTPKTLHKLNAFLPPDIAIHGIYLLHDEAHARFDANRRTYHYYIATEKDVFGQQTSWHYPMPLNLEKMNQACSILLGYTDFECFSKAHTDVKTFDCKIYQAHWQEAAGKITFTITADRFLRNMVRAIVGTMVNIGSGKIEPEALHTIIQSKDRSQAGFSVPAHGLYLTQIEYPYLP